MGYHLLFTDLCATFGRQRAKKGRTQFAPPPARYGRWVDQNQVMLHDSHWPTLPIHSGDAPTRLRPSRRGMRGPAIGTLRPGHSAVGASPNRMGHVEQCSSWAIIYFLPIYAPHLDADAQKRVARSLR